MNTFLQTAKKGDFFSYQVGNVKTTKVWTRPSYRKMRYFLERIKKDTNILNEYEVSVIGGVLFSFENTWDLDLCLNGEIHSFEKLEESLSFMYDIALNELQMLIDVQWLDKAPPKISYEEFISPEFKKPKLNYVKLNPILKQIGEGITFSDLTSREGNFKVNNFLVQGQHEEFPNKKKFTDKILEYPNKLLKSSINVQEILMNNESYFFKNTNRF